jgi:hypothetical protein
MMSNCMGKVGVLLAIALSSHASDYDLRYEAPRGSDYGDILKARRKNQRNKAQCRKRKG